MSHPQRPIPPELFEALERQTLLSEQLLDLLDEELQVLTRMDIQTLVGLTRKKESLLKRLQLLDATFQEIASGLGGESPSREPIRLREIIASAEPETATRLEEYRGRLVALRHKIHDRNLLNKQLAGDILGYLNDAVALIANGASGQPGYGARGPARLSSRQPALISREI